MFPSTAMNLYHVTAHPWIEWPDSERSGGPPATPMDETFFTKWRERMLAQRCRPAINPIDQTTTIGAASNSAFANIGPAGEIFFPPWAERLLCRLHYVWTQSPADTGTVLFRFNFNDGIFSSESGWFHDYPTNPGAITCALDVPEAIRGTTRPVQLQYKFTGGGGCTALKVSSAYQKDRSGNNIDPYAIPWLWTMSDMGVGQVTDQL